MIAIPGLWLWLELETFRASRGAELLHIEIYGLELFFFLLQWNVLEADVTHGRGCADICYS